MSLCHKKYTQVKYNGYGKKSCSHARIKNRRIGVKKHFLFLLIVFLAFMVIVSCKKKEDTTSNSPVVTVAEDNSSSRSLPEPKTFDKETPKITLAKDVEKAEINENSEVVEEKEKKISFVYRGGSVLLKSTFRNDSADIITNVSEDEARVFAKRLIEENPEYMDIYSVSFSGNVVSLTYPSSLTEEDISSFWDSLKALMDKVMEENSAKEEEKDKEKQEASDSPVVEENTTIPVEETISEEIPPQREKAEEEKSEQLEKEKKLFEEISETISSQKGSPSAVTPLTKAGKYITENSVSLSMSAKYDPQYGFDSDIRAAFDMHFMPSLGIGVGLGYEMTGYIPLTLRLRYTIFDGLYTYLGGGWRFGFGGRNGNLILNIGLGYEYEVLDNVYLFGEFDGEIVFMDKVRFMPSLALGARYVF